MTLYEINEQIKNVLENCYDPETGEIYDEELMTQYDSLRLQREEKAENVACYIKNLRAESAAIKEESKKLAARAKSADNKADHLEDYLRYCLQGNKLNTARCAVGYRKSKAVDVEPDAWQFLPEQYLRVKQPEPDKKAIGDALKAGQNLPGCKLVENISMIIK